MIRLDIVLIVFKSYSLARIPLFIKAKDDKADRATIDLSASSKSDR